MSEKELMQIQDPKEFFKKSKELQNTRLTEVRRRYNEDTLIVREEGQWSVKTGLEREFSETDKEVEIVFDEARGH